MAYDGSVRIRTELDTKGFRDGRKQIESGLSGLRSSLAKAASAIGVAFGTAAVANFAKESVEAASALQNALAGLESIVEGQGRSFAKAQAFIQDYIADGLVPMANAVTAYKNLAARGYDDTQIQQVLTALKDSAAYGRQASLSLGEAVQSASEGLKNENSILVDNAGVTKNVAKMWDDYAKSIGTTAANLTQEQKIQAEVNGILSETRFQTGDAAKAAGSYSGQVAQLGFNFNNLKVAVGNAGMALAQSMLPAVNSIVLSLTQAANVAAQFITALFGGKTAAQNQKTAATASQAAKQEAKLADEITAAAKAAENAQGSIDELNIIQQDAGVSGATGGASSSTAGDTAAGAIGEIGAEVTVSPKIQAAADKVRKFLEDLRQALKEFSPLLSGIAAGFLTAFSMKWVAGAAANLKKLAGTSSLFKGIAAAAGAVATNFKATGKLFPSLNAGFKQLRASLSNTTKAMVGAAGCVAAFVSVKSAVSDLTLGNIDLETALLNIVPALAVVGTALYAALGPWGLLAGAIAAAAGALIGYLDAQNKLREQRLEDSFFDGVGVSIDTFAERIRLMGEDVSDSTDYILGLGDAIAGNQADIDTAVKDIDYFMGKVQAAGGQISDEDVPKMEEAFNSLYDNIKENMDLSAKSLVYTLQEVVGKSAQVSSEKIDSMIGKVYELNALLSKDADVIKRQMDKIFEKIVSGTATQEEETQFSVLFGQLEALSGEATLAESKFKTMVQEINSQKIDFTDTDTAKDKIAEIGDLGAQMVKDLGEAGDEAVREVDTWLQRIEGSVSLSEAEKAEWKKIFTDMRDDMVGSFELKEADVKDEISAALGAIQSQFDKQKQALIDKESGKNGDSFLGQMMDRFITDGVAEQTVNNQFSSIQEAIDAAAGKLEITPNPELGKELLDDMYDLGQDAASGFKSGADSQKSQVNQAGKDLFGAAESGTYQAGDYGSPSKIMKKYGEWAADGFINGANGKKTAVAGAFGGLFNAVLDKADVFCERLRGAINDALSGMRAAVGSVSLGAGGTLRFSAMPPVKIPRLATGAVIPPNAQFAAILGDQTHGRNLEAPESLIRQIVREESGGASQELIDRIDRLIRAVEEKDMTVTVGITDREVAQANQRGLRSLGYPVRGT